MIKKLILLLLPFGLSLFGFAQKVPDSTMNNHVNNDIDFGFVQEQAEKEGKYKKLKYKSGALSSEGYLLEGNPIGTWVSYYQSGTVKTVGMQWQGKPVGDWTFYSKNGVIDKYYQYDSTGLLHGKTITYDSAGCEKRILFYENGIKDGPMKSFHPNGKVKKVAYYKDGEKEGKSYEYSEEDGSLLTEQVYEKGKRTVNAKFNRRNEEGKKTGVWRTYYGDGTIKTEATYKNGVLNGIYKSYKKNGEMRLLTRFEEGVEDKEAKKELNINYYKTFHDNGKIHLFGLLKDGKKNGIIREYGRQGNIINGYLYDMDTLRAEGIIDKKGEYQGRWKIYYPSGKVRAIGKYYNNLKDSTWVYFYRDSTVEQKGKFDRGTHVDYWRWYFKNGDLRKEEYYRRGKLEGETIEYDSSRNVIVRGEYLDGLKEGEWFYDVGDHTEEGQYTMGLKTDEWKHFYPDGTLKFKGEYRDGEPIGVHKYYYSNGVKSKKGNYIRGQKDGTWKTYNKMGEKEHYVQYERGEKIRIDGVKIEN